MKSFSNLEFPFFASIKESKNILLSGAGGGFDFLCAMPLYFSLKEKGYQVYLSNITFSHLDTTSGEKLCENMLEVTSESHGINKNGSWCPIEEYFPEYQLCKWFKEERKEEVSVFCFKRVGVKKLHEAYSLLVKKLHLDTIILIDGGTDSLCFGDESGLGTPVEDSASLLSVNLLDKSIKKLLVAIGWGIDFFHGVCHSHVLQNISKLIKSDGYLGNFSVMKEMDEYVEWEKSAKYIFKKMPGSESIVVASILSAIEGNFGDYHMYPERTKGSKLFINPLMSIYWCFFLDPLAQNILYSDKILNTDTAEEIQREISLFVETLQKEGKQRKFTKVPF